MFASPIKGTPALLEAVHPFSGAKVHWLSVESRHVVLMEKAEILGKVHAVELEDPCVARLPEWNMHNEIYWLQMHQEAQVHQETQETQETQEAEETQQAEQDQGASETQEA